MFIVLRIYNFGHNTCHTPVVVIMGSGVGNGRYPEVEGGCFEDAYAVKTAAYEAHHLEISYYVNFLGHLGSNGFQLK